MVPMTPVAINDMASSAIKVADIGSVVDPILFMQSLLFVAVIMEMMPAVLIVPSAMNVAIPISRIAISLCVCDQQVQHRVNTTIITIMQFNTLCMTRNSHSPMQCITMSSVCVLTTVINVMMVATVHMQTATYGIA